MRNGTIRRAIRLKRGTRSSRRRNSKVIDGSRTRGGTGGKSVIRTRSPRASVIVDRLEKQYNAGTLKL